MEEHKQYRVEIGQGTDLEVVEGGPRSMRAQTRMVDISATGVAVRAPREAESALADINRVTVFVFLPDYRHPLVLTGIIRNRCRAGAEIYYDIEFDMERSENPRQQQDAIIEDVIKHQGAPLMALTR